MRKIGLIALLLAALVTVGCEEKTIAEIKANPARYRDKDVGFVGEVVRSYSVMNYGVYEVSDRTGSIYVVTNRGGTPARGSRVGVRGNVWQGFNLPIPNIDKYGTFIREKQLKVKN